MSTATKTKTLEGWRGDAAIYKLDPPTDAGLEYVVVSAVDLDFGNIGTDMSWYRKSETMIFPSDGDDVLDFGELVMVPEKSHASALADLGYEVAS